MYTKTNMVIFNWNYRMLLALPQYTISFFRKLWYKGLIEFETKYSYNTKLLQSNAHNKGRCHVYCIFLTDNYVQVKWGRYCWQSPPRSIQMSCVARKSLLQVTTSLFLFVAHTIRPEDMPHNFHWHVRVFSKTIDVTSAARGS